MARERRSTGKGGSADRRRPMKKKISILYTERVEYIDYKDVNLLRRFMSERAKIRARRVTGNSAQQQRAVARAIRVAREMALLPYSVRQVTQRKGGGRRDRGDRGELREEYPQRPPQAPDSGELSGELGGALEVDVLEVDVLEVDVLEVDVLEVDVLESIDGADDDAPAVSGTDPAIEGAVEGAAVEGAVEEDA